jgi:outer membrane protein assembly factor BamB
MNRDGHVSWLPDKLPSAKKSIWERRMTSDGVGGVAATTDYVIVSDRNTHDKQDIWRCLRTSTGEEVWSLRYSALGKLDYGNSPRATPTMYNDRVFLLGAFGHLHCVNLKTGEVIWKKDIRSDFKVTAQLTWGYASSPLIVDGKVIVNPGADDASIVALDCSTGEVVWQTPGNAPAFSSFVLKKFGGKQQVIGYDAKSLGGWDSSTGKRLWTLIPPEEHDFNVPTPVIYDGKLIVCSENNGSRIYAFDANDVIDPKPVGKFGTLAPDSHSPVVSNHRLFGVHEHLYCLNAKNLDPNWIGNDEAFANYSSLIATDNRVLCLTQEGELVLIDSTADKFFILGKLPLFKDENGIYSHPAIVKSWIFVRGASKLICIDLAANN